MRRSIYIWGTGAQRYMAVVAPLEALSHRNGLYTTPFRVLWLIIPASRLYDRPPLHIRPCPSIAEHTNILRRANTSKQAELSRLRAVRRPSPAQPIPRRLDCASEDEVGEENNHYEDVLNATCAAVEEGILLGGDVALLKASLALLSTSPPRRPRQPRPRGSS